MSIHVTVEPVMYRFAVVSLVLAVLCGPAQADVVINEIFYHAPDDIDDLQFIEGMEDELVGRIQKRTGQAKKKIERTVNESCSCHR